MKERVTKRADQFSHKDLLDYMNTITAAAEKASKQINTVDTTPIIQMNTQNNTVIVGESMDRESRQRVMDTVSALLAKMGIEQPGDLVPENEVFEINSEKTEEIDESVDELVEITETTSVLNIDESFEPEDDSGEIHFNNEDDF